MKKIFLVKFNGDSFFLESNDKVMKIARSDLEFKGNEFYSNFLSSLDVSKKVNFEVQKDESLVWTNDDDRIFNQLSKLIKEIENKINIEFNLFTEDVDRLLNDFD